MTFTPVTTAPTGYPQGVNTATLHHFAKCWRLTRTDGTILRFTEAAQPLTVLTAADTQETFDPADGMQTSAEQLQSGLAEQNFEAEGILSDSRITHDDLRAGLYQDCQLDVLLVDWSAPELGAYYLRTFWIEKVAFAGSMWKADIVGLSGWMRRNEGDLYVPACQHDLGDARCKINLATITESSRSVSAVVDQRKEFTSNVSSQPDGYFAYGVVTWTSGANAGLQSEVYSSLMTGGTIILRLPTPYDIAASDGFTIYPGCQKRRVLDCRDKFSNLVNFGGFPFVPGSDKLLEIPGQK